MRLPGWFSNVRPLLFGLFVAVLSSGLAEEHAAAQALAGLRGGVTRTTLLFNGDDSGYQSGRVAGGWVRLPLGGAVALQLEAYYFEKGASGVGGELPGPMDMRYLELPLMLVFLIQRESPVSGYVSTGGSFSVLQTCDFFPPSSGGEEIECAESGIGGPRFYSPEDFDFGLVLGAGAEFDLEVAVLTLDVRAGFGLSDALHSYSSDFNSDTDAARHRSIAFMAGIAFPVG